MRGDHYFVGAYFENIGIPVIRRETKGNTRFMGLSVKNIRGYSEGSSIVGNKPNIFALPDGFSNFYATGIVRDMDDDVGFEHDGEFYELIPRSNFVNANGDPISAQSGYEINILDHVRGLTLDLPSNSELSLGRRYIKDFGSGGSRTITFKGPVEKSKRVELRTQSTGEVTLTIPESVVAGETGSMTEIILEAGYHVLVWDRVDELWWLTID